MKAITLTQPWATLVATGEKTFETRSWKTNYRGILAIHAAKNFPHWAQQQAITPEFQKSLNLYGYTSIKDLPTSAIIGIVKMEGCVPTGTFLLEQALTEKERTFGDFRNGRFGWLFSRSLTMEPIQCKGALSIWEIPREIERQILQQLSNKPF